MGISQEQVDFAFEPVGFLDYAAASGAELRQQAIQLYHARNLRDAARCASELYHLGLKEHDPLLQGLACYLLGTIYFGLGNRGNDWERARDFFEQAISQFHLCPDPRREFNEGVAWYALARLYERMCRDKDRWEAAIDAYKKADALFKRQHDPLAAMAEDAERRVTRKWKDQLTIKHHVQELAFILPRTQAAPGSASPAPNADPPPNVAQHALSAPSDSATGCLALAFWVFGALLYGVTPLALYAITRPEYQTPVLVGYGLALVALAINLGVLIGAGQITFVVPPGCAALVSSRGRVWQLDAPGRKLLLPWVEQLLGIFALNHPALEIFLREFATHDGFTLSVRAQADCRLGAPLKVWAHLGATMPARRVLWIVRPLALAQTSAHTQAEARRLLNQTLIEIAHDPLKRDLFTQKPIQAQAFAPALNRAAEPTGLQFTPLRVEAFVRHVPQAIPAPVWLAIEPATLTLPYPQNADTARDLLALARAHRAEPRLFGVMQGELKRDLQSSEFDHLARAHGVALIARRELGVALAQKQDGVLTLGATMWLAHRFGMRVVVADALGGLEQPWAATPDLLELTRTPVVVVTAGIQPACDMRATLRWLAANEVPVIGYQTAELPALYARASGLALTQRVETPAQAAEAAFHQWQAGGASGVLLCVPAPISDELPLAEFASALQQARVEAEPANVADNQHVAAVSARLKELTRGASVRANVAALRNNVIVAAQVADALARLAQVAA